MKPLVRESDQSICKGDDSSSLHEVMILAGTSSLGQAE